MQSFLFEHKTILSSDKTLCIVVYLQMENFASFLSSDKKLCIWAGNVVLSHEFSLDFIRF